MPAIMRARIVVQRHRGGKSPLRCLWSKAYSWVAVKTRPCCCGLFLLMTSLPGGRGVPPVAVPRLGPPSRPHRLGGSHPEPPGPRDRPTAQTSGAGGSAPDARGRTASPSRCTRKATPPHTDRARRPTPLCVPLCGLERRGVESWSQDTWGDARRASADPLVLHGTLVPLAPGVTHGLTALRPMYGHAASEKTHGVIMSAVARDATRERGLGAWRVVMQERDTQPPRCRRRGVFSPVLSRRAPCGRHPGEPAVDLDALSAAYRYMIAHFVLHVFPPQKAIASGGGSSLLALWICNK